MILRNIVGTLCCLTKEHITKIPKHNYFVQSKVKINMAKSRFEYVKKFECEDKLLLNCWIVVRVDGRSFHKFTEKHDFEKPNDNRGLNLMNQCAIKVMQEFKDICLAYGQSDEYSFIFRKDTQIYNRRASKIASYVNSLFSSSYVFYWNYYFPNVMIKYPPMFDSRIILYPTNENLQDYLSWRQADVHVNNLYNTTFWKLVLDSGMTNSEAEKALCGTLSSDKNEILFSKFGINYNKENVMFRKGTILMRKRLQHSSIKPFQLIVPLHEDMIKAKFWKDHPEILQQESPGNYKWPEEIQLHPIVISQISEIK